MEPDCHGRLARPSRAPSPTFPDELTILIRSPSELVGAEGGKLVTLVPAPPDFATDTASDSALPPVQAFSPRVARVFKEHSGGKARGE